MSRRLRLTLALTLAALLGPAAVTAHAAPPVSPDPGGISVNVVIPAAGVRTITDAQLRWSLNQEVSSGAHFGGCNFLSAGRAGDAGSSHVWGAEEKLYAATAGNTRIEKPTAAGTWGMDSWDDKCVAADGHTVTTSATEAGTGAQVVMEGGTGTLDAGQKSATISWSGSFTVAMYGGLTYWSASDPVLTVADGVGTLRATASGYAADRVDSSVWRTLPERTVTLATLPAVALGENGIVTEPAYRGVTATDVDPVQDRADDNAQWGAFPQDFLNFHASTGQGSYWYSSGTTRDPAKVASTLFISYSAELPVLTPMPPPAVVETTTGGTVTNTWVLPTLPPTIFPALPASTFLSQVVAAPPVTGVVSQAVTPTVQAVTWLGTSLIPQAVELTQSHRDALLWAVAGLLILLLLAWLSFRRGWLQWPFRNPPTS